MGLLYIHVESVLSSLYRGMGRLLRLTYESRVHHRYFNCIRAHGDPCRFYIFYTLLYGVWTNPASPYRSVVQAICKVVDLTRRCNFHTTNLLASYEHSYLENMFLASIIANVHMTSVLVTKKNIKIFHFCTLNTSTLLDGLPRTIT
jgi:hypothetical protein